MPSAGNEAGINEFINPSKGIEDQGFDVMDVLLRELIKWADRLPNVKQVTWPSSTQAGEIFLSLKLLVTNL